MALDRLTVLRFDTGIEEIVNLDGFESPSLPDADVILPNESYISSHLERVLTLPSFDSRILEELKPEVSFKEILIPTRYRALLRESLEVLEEMKGVDGELLNRGRELFEEENGLLSVFLFFNNILVKA